MFQADFHAKVIPVRTVLPKLLFFLIQQFRYLYMTLNQIGGLKNQVPEFIHFFNEPVNITIKQFPQIQGPGLTRHKGHHTASMIQSQLYDLDSPAFQFLVVCMQYLQPFYPLWI